jgi:hypothetical protein
MGEEKTLFSKVAKDISRSILLFLAIAGVVLLPVLGAQDSAEEYAVKAAFLYNFARFTDWPTDCFPEEDSPIVVCIFGRDPFGDTIEFLQKKTIHGRPVVLKREERLASLEVCHILFVSSSKRDQLDEIVGKTAGWSVLTVSDMEEFAHKGGGVGFVHKDNKIRFEVNPETTKKAGLRLSSKLLRLALLVSDSAQHAGGS